MTTASPLLNLAIICLTLAAHPLLKAVDANYQPELFKSTQLIYADTFDGALNTEFWEVRQNTTWAIKDGVLTGSPSSKEFQAQKKASDDPSHAGLKPVIWLKGTPGNSKRLSKLIKEWRRGGK